MAPALLAAALATADGVDLDAGSCNVSVPHRLSALNGSCSNNSLVLLRQQNTAQQDHHTHLTA